VSDTAIDAVNRVLAESKEKVSKDYKVMKKMTCKGGSPGLMQIKLAQDNPLISNLDPNKHETDDQKFI